jgi:hypothetical protein
VKEEVRMVEAGQGTVVEAVAVEPSEKVAVRVRVRPDRNSAF